MSEKNYAHPEFFFLSRVQQLLEKYPTLPEVKALERDTRQIVNENSLFMMQVSNLYILLGNLDDLDAATIRVLRTMLASSLSLIDTYLAEKRNAGAKTAAGSAEGSHGEQTVREAQTK